MPTTTLKLSAELKARIAPLARRAGKSPHAWMVEALEREAGRCELREKFIEAGEESAADVGGSLYAAEDVHAYLAARLSGGPERRPAPAKRSRRR